MLEELNEVNNYIHKKIEKYINRSALLLEIERHAEENSVPIIGKEVAEYLKFILVSHKNIKKILEIGTATAYSGIVMLGEIQDRCGELTTVEIDEERFKIAKENFEKSNLKGVNQIFGDALDEIKKINQNFDFIFIDAAKGQYKNFFEDSYKLLNEGGIIFIDNILFRGYLYKDVPKRYKTLVRKLEEFIDFLYENYNFTLLPVSDGIGLVYKKEIK